MQRFTCQSCGNDIHFDSRMCVACGSQLGFLPENVAMTAIAPMDGGWRALAAPGNAVRLCQNHGSVGCTWLIPPDQPSPFCLACRFNRTVPDLATFSVGVTSTRDRWAEVERAKRWLFWSLLRWNLPLPMWSSQGKGGLGFDFLTDADAPVLTGHDDGVITLNLAEGDATERTRRREVLGETYRTPIGHFRHEIGHFYWDILVRDAGRQPQFRAVFGDERADYAAALEAHYRSGSPPDWAASHVSPYATAHPWEDFAETWAHWMHMVDGLETVQAYGLRTQQGDGARYDPYRGHDVETVVAAWVPYTIAINAVNRSMGQPDVYPFVVTSAIKAKLQFINSLVHGI